MIDNTQNASLTAADNAFNRQKLLSLSSKVLEKIEHRLTAERFRESESDNTYLAFVRAFSGLMTAHNMTLRDSELQELEARISQLETEKESVRVRE